MNKFDYLVFIGRFEPFHLGHKFVIEQAMQQTRQLIILIGSANAPRTLKNPFSFDERVLMIQGAFDDNTCQRLHFLPIDDTLYNDHQWIQNIQWQVSAVTKDDVNAKIGIIGHNKDESSYYLSLFPQWCLVTLPNFENLSATPLRLSYFSGCDDIDRYLPTSSQKFLQNFSQTKDFSQLQKEYQHIVNYQNAWQYAPYPPIFVTTDALIVQAGHILLIERGGEYGQGLWAMPGGFLDKDETLLQCMIREVKEETGLILNKSCIKNQEIFDKPDRSLRGRTITTVFYCELYGNKLPTVVGADDANCAFWLPLSKLDGNRFFEDHYGIIVKMLGL